MSDFRRKYIKTEIPRGIHLTDLETWIYEIIIMQKVIDRLGLDELTEENMDEHLMNKYGEDFNETLNAIPQREKDQALRVARMMSWVVRPNDDDIDLVLNEKEIEDKENGEETPFVYNDNAKMAANAILDFMFKQPVGELKTRKQLRETKNKNNG